MTAAPLAAALAAPARRQGPDAETMDALARALPLPVRTLALEPPPRVLWLLPLLLMAVTSAGIGWAVLGQVDIVAPSQATLVPSGRVKVIQPPEQRVVRRILVEEGQRVAAGDRLLEFDVSDLEADRDRLSKELAGLRLRAARLRAALAATEGVVPGAAGGAAGGDAGGAEGGAALSAAALSAPAFDPPPGADPRAVADERALLVADRARLAGEVAALGQEIARQAASRDAIAATIGKLEATLPLVRRRVEARRGLVERGVASATEFLAMEQELVAAEADLRIQRANLREAEAARAASAERMGQAVRAHRHQAAIDLVEAEARAAGVVEELRKAERRLASLDLAAPEDGTVHELALHTVGAVVQAAQPLMRLVPAGAALEAEAKVLNRDAGFVRAGQEVQVKLDAFPFTKYGAVPGRVVAVSSDVVEDQRLGPVYRARVELTRQTVEAEGRTVTLSPGMSAVVDVHTGRRRVIDYLLGPVLKYRDEAMRER
jgi:hemolysin D